MVPYRHDFCKGRLARGLQSVSDLQPPSFFWQAVGGHREWLRPKGACEWPRERQHFAIYIYKYPVGRSRCRHGLAIERPGYLEGGITLFFMVDLLF